MEQIRWFSDLSKKIGNAVEMLKMFEPVAMQYNPKGYYLAFSGGKDSVAIYHLAKIAGVHFDAHYHLTTVDPPELVRFIREKYPDVITERPEYSMWELIVKKQIPPTRRVRYCCEVLKEGGGTGRFTVTGVRWQESRSRSKRAGIEIERTGRPAQLFLNCDNSEIRRQIENCTLKGRRILNPIIDWSEEDVWCFIRMYGCAYCCLYDEGFLRLGCIGCPLASTRNRIREFNRYPGYEKAYIRAFDRMVKAREEGGKISRLWRDGTSVFEWWLFNGAKRESQIEGQLEMSEFIDMAA